MADAEAGREDTSEEAEQDFGQLTTDLFNGQPEEAEVKPEAVEVEAEQPEEEAAKEEAAQEPGNEDSELAEILQTEHVKAFLDDNGKLQGEKLLKSYHHLNKKMGERSTTAKQAEELQQQLDQINEFLARPDMSKAIEREVAIMNGTTLPEEPKAKEATISPDEVNKKAVELMRSGQMLAAQELLVESSSNFKEMKQRLDLLQNKTEKASEEQENQKAMQGFLKAHISDGLFEEKQDGSIGVKDEELYEKLVAVLDEEPNIKWDNALVIAERRLGRQVAPRRKKAVPPAKSAGARYTIMPERSSNDEAFAGVDFEAAKKMFGADMVTRKV